MKISHQISDTPLQAMPSTGFQGHLYIPETANAGVSAKELQKWRDASL